MKELSDIPLILGRLRPSKLLTITSTQVLGQCAAYVEVPFSPSISPSPNGQGPETILCAGLSMSLHVHVLRFILFKFKNKNAEMNLWETNLLFLVYTQVVWARTHNHHNVLGHAQDSPGLASGH